jgi:hypothetical protein
MWLIFPFICIQTKLTDITYLISNPPASFWHLNLSNIRIIGLLFLKVLWDIPLCIFSFNPNFTDETGAINFSYNRLDFKI